MTVDDFLSQVRINRVKIILDKRPDVETEELALDVGFTDTKLFITAFNDVCGVTIEEYRNALQRTERVS